MSSSIMTIARFLQLWIWDGVCRDEHDEFMVAASNEVRVIFSCPRYA